MNIKIFEKSYLFPKSRPHPTPSLFTATHTTLSIQINTNNFLLNQVLFFFFFLLFLLTSALSAWTISMVSFIDSPLVSFLLNLKKNFFLIKLY